jgi:hypothetical protein
MTPIPASSFPAPRSLAVVLQAAGYQPTLFVQRTDGATLTPEDAERVRALLEAHADGQEQFTNRELWEALGAVRAGGSAPPRATGTDG